MTILFFSVKTCIWHVYVVYNVYTYVYVWFVVCRVYVHVCVCVWNQLPPISLSDLADSKDLYIYKLTKL